VIYSEGYAANIWQNFEGHMLGSTRKENPITNTQRDLEPDSEVDGLIVVNGNDPVLGVNGFFV